MSGILWFLSSLALALLTVNLIPAGASAKPTKPKAKKSRPAPPREIYSAIEADEISTMPSPEASRREVARIVRFDSVPSQHTQSILTRLALIEALIRDHGRAYDYRTLTTRELERILAELNESRDQDLIPPPPPQARIDSAAGPS